MFIYLFVDLAFGISFSWRFLEKFISRATSFDSRCAIVNSLGKFEIKSDIKGVLHKATFHIEDFNCNRVLDDARIHLFRGVGPGLRIFNGKWSKTA